MVRQFAGHNPAGLHHSDRFRQHLHRILYMLQNVRGVHHIERSVRKRQRLPHRWSDAFRIKSIDFENFLRGSERTTETLPVRLNAVPIDGKVLDEHGKVDTETRSDLEQLLSLP